MAHYAGIMSGALSERTRDILTRHRRIAMVGVSANPTRASYRAMVHMLSKGYTVYPVNPGSEQVLGVRCLRRPWSISLRPRGLCRKDWMRCASVVMVPMCPFRAAANPR